MGPSRFPESPPGVARRMKWVPHKKGSHEEGNDGHARVKVVWLLPAARAFFQSPVILVSRRRGRKRRFAEIVFAVVTRQECGDTHSVDGVRWRSQSALPALPQQAVACERI